MLPHILMLVQDNSTMFDIIISPAPEITRSCSLRCEILLCLPRSTLGWMAACELGTG